MVAARLLVVESIEAHIYPLHLLAHCRMGWWCAAGLSIAKVGNIFEPCKSIMVHKRKRAMAERKSIFIR